MSINSNKRSGFKVFCLIIIMVIVTVSFVACKGKDNSDNNALNTPGVNEEQDNSDNSALKSIGSDSVKSDALAVIINNPSTEKLDKITDLKTFEFDKASTETLLIVPSYNKMNIEIKTLVWENDALKEDKIVYKEENTKDGFGLLLKAYRPEGIPALKICISGNDLSGEYILSYNGKDGTPDIEYIVEKKD